MAVPAKHLQKTKRASCALGDNVKDEEGNTAVFSEQVASASRMTAAKFLDNIAKLLGMAGEASDAVPAYTQVKIAEAPRLLQLLEVAVAGRTMSRDMDHNSLTPKTKSWDKIECLPGVAICRCPVPGLAVPRVASPPSLWARAVMCGEIAPSGFTHKKRMSCQTASERRQRRRNPLAGWQLIPSRSGGDNAAAHVAFYDDTKWVRFSQKWRAVAINCHS